jgi:hypothetical protein
MGPIVISGDVHDDDFGMIPLTVPEPGARSAACPRPTSPGTGGPGGAATRPAHAGTHERTRLARNTEIILVSNEWLLPYQ